MPKPFPYLAYRRVFVRSPGLRRTHHANYTETRTIATQTNTQNGYWGFTRSRCHAATTGSLLIRLCSFSALTICPNTFDVVPMVRSKIAIISSSFRVPLMPCV